MTTTLHQLNALAHRQVMVALKKSTPSDRFSHATMLLIGAHNKVLARIKERESDLIRLSESYIEIGVQQAVTLGLVNEALENPVIFESMFPQQKHL